MLFDKICRRNGITHRLTTLASPNRTARSSGSMACSASTAHGVGQKFARGRSHRYGTVTVHVAENALTIALDG